MRKKFLATASIIALMSVSPAFAGTANTDDSMAKDAAEQVKEGWDKTKEAVKSTAENATEATKDAYRDFKAFIFSDDEGKLDVEQVKVNPRTTATGIIGEPVYNFNKERVGVVKDIILDQDGKAAMVIIGDGDFFGLGKLAAFDYDAMVEMTKDGDIIMPLTEETIDRAAEFSFDTSEAGGNVRVMPNNAYSVEKLLDAELVNAKGEKLGDVDDITFKAGNASQLIIGFDKILGLGGEEISLAYDDATLVQDGDDGFKYSLSAKKSSLISTHKALMN